MNIEALRIAFIGAAGVPNRYGGFEAFLDACAPILARSAKSVIVTCDRLLYTDHTVQWKGVERIFIGTPANGAISIVHDLIAFLSVWRRSTHIVILGVSGGVWFPLFRIMCDATKKRLIVNVDGIEWQRTKFGLLGKTFLRLSDCIAQIFAHHIVIDNDGLEKYLTRSATKKYTKIAYSGDHVHVPTDVEINSKAALTICRIEPENNIEMMIEGALDSDLNYYTIIGNWNHSQWAKGIREKYKYEPRLNLLDPIYEPECLGRHRASCSVYIHGHSVGGTNPSLVEMLFYDCKILCLDINFHHHTAGDAVEYFSDAKTLSRSICADSSFNWHTRNRCRNTYSAEAIANQYISLLQEE